MSCWKEEEIMRGNGRYKVLERIERAGEPGTTAHQASSLPIFPNHLDKNIGVGLLFLFSDAIDRREGLRGGRF